VSVQLQPPQNSVPWGHVGAPGGGGGGDWAAAKRRKRKIAGTLSRCAAAVLGCHRDLAWARDSSANWEVEVVVDVAEVLVVVSAVETTALLVNSTELVVMLVVNATLGRTSLGATTGVLVCDVVSVVP
jgi:hypothetical protein